MKTLFAALLLLGSTTVFAQSRDGRWEERGSRKIEESRTIINGNERVYRNDRYEGRYDGYMTSRERDMLIHRIR